MRVWIGGVGVVGPGMPDWPTARDVLAGRRPWTKHVVAPPPAILPANERRRAGLPVRIALAAAGEAVRMSGQDPADLRCVFASANGEGAIVHALMETVVSADPVPSPTRFQNSVHNAVAGYWAMAAGSRHGVTCLGAWDGTAEAALLVAAAEVVAEQAPVLLCVYDAPMPAPLDTRRPTAFPFAVALVLLPDEGGLAPLDVAWRDGAGDPSLPQDGTLRALASGNAAARLLLSLPTSIMSG